MSESKRKPRANTAARTKPAMKVRSGAKTKPRKASPADVAASTQAADAKKAEAARKRAIESSRAGKDSKRKPKEDPKHKGHEDPKRKGNVDSKRKVSEDPKRDSGKAGREKTEKGRSSPVWLFILLGAIIILVIAVWSYYPVAKQQYIASREKERLEAELAIIEERNQQLQDEIDRLGTDEGIEDYARNELGWVKKGEESVIVEGLDSGAKSSTGVDWRVEAEDIKLKNTRWTRFLDMIFGIESE